MKTGDTLLMKYCIAACSALLVLGSVTTAPATTINSNAGTTGFNFLKIGVGARSAALGGAYAAIVGDIEASAWNPAGVLGVKERSAALSLNSYLIDSQAGFVSVVFPKNRRVLALSANYVTYGNLQRTDEEGRDLGLFSAADLAAYLTVAQQLGPDWLAVGANLKAVYSSIDAFSSDAYLADFGLLARGPIKGMSLGASIANIGFVRSGYAGDFKDSLPVHIRLGLAHRPAHMPVPMLLVADFNMPNDNDPYFSFGLEVQLAGGLYIRPGYSTQQTGVDGDDPLGMTAGAGLGISRYIIDYAYSSFPDLGDVHRVSIIGDF